MASLALNTGESPVVWGKAPDFHFSRHLHDRT
jgi:hypothetical protein